MGVAKKKKEIPHILPQIFRRTHTHLHTKSVGIKATQRSWHRRMVEWEKRGKSERVSEREKII